jgi:hypothetical protein
LNPHPRTSYYTSKKSVSDDVRRQTTHDVLTLQGGTLSAILAGLEAEVSISDERVPFVDLLKTAAKSAGEDQTT